MCSCLLYCGDRHNECESVDQATAVQRRAARIVLALIVALNFVTSAVFSLAVDRPLATFSYLNYSRVELLLTRVCIDGNCSARLLDECPSMIAHLSATNLFMTFTFYLYLCILWGYFSFVALSFLRAALGRRCRPLQLLCLRLRSVMTTMMSTLLCLIPVASLLLLIAAFLAIDISVSRLCREAGGGMFVRPLSHRRNFAFGAAGWLIIAGTITCGAGTVLGIVVLVSARKEFLELTALATAEEIEGEGQDPLAEQLGDEPET